MMHPVWSVVALAAFIAASFAVCVVCAFARRRHPDWGLFVLSFVISLGWLAVHVLIPRTKSLANAVFEPAIIVLINAAICGLFSSRLPGTERVSTPRVLVVCVAFVMVVVIVAAVTPPLPE